MRFALLEFLITAGVLYVIYRLIVWIGHTTKRKLDEEEKWQEQQEKKESK